MMFGAVHFIYYIHSHESRFNLFGLLTNNTQRIYLVASGGRELMTFRSQSPTLSRYTTHVKLCFNFVKNNLEAYDSDASSTSSF